MPAAWRVEGRGASIIIDVLGYEHAGAQDAYDANWLKCWVRVRVGPFSGEYAASFTTHDFVQFRDAVRAALSNMSGTASFRTHEGALQLDLDLDKGGRVRLSGLARDCSQPGVCLTFSVESDQSFLQRAKEELDLVVAEYPVVRAE